MSRVLDFNFIERPVLELVMQDDERTHIRVSTPTESLVEELAALAPQLEKVLQAKDTESTKAIYDLAARLINCNRDCIKVTPEELRGKFRMNFESLIIFFGAYVDFINEVTNAKN
jgi:hypothetical protein